MFNLTVYNMFNVSLDSIVLKEDLTKWPLGKVVEVHTGKDNLV